MSVVIDASVTMQWYFQDEFSSASERLLQRIVSEGAVVPSHWRLEVANSFRSAIRRKRINHEYRDQSLADLGELNIEIDGETAFQAWELTLRLADEFGLTPYDAAYLELALRRQLPLATLDRDLISAAKASGIEFG